MLGIQQPIYDIDKSWEENLVAGPQFEGPIPKRSETPRTNFLGYSLKSPLGVPAGPLLDSRWIQLAARLGYDVLTYKTIRSKEKPAHPLPNILFVDTQEALDPTHLPKSLVVSEDFSSASITNSFGMPSKDPDFLKEDIPKARECLGDGQILLVSVTGDREEDFTSAVQIAKAAHGIEVNFSCPNVSKGQGELYLDPKAVFSLGRAVVEAAMPLPVVMKVGVFPSSSLLDEVLSAAVSAGIRAVSGINTISMPVTTGGGTPALGLKRPTSGICGKAIFQAGLDFVSAARALNSPLEIVGVGGIMGPEDVNAYLKTGANVAMTATGMMWNPYLADEYHRWINTKSF